MTHAIHRMGLDAIRSSQPLAARDRTSRGSARDPNNSAAAAQLLSTALALDNADASIARSGTTLSANPNERFDTAVRLYESGHWKLAFVNLAALADQGDARAAKLALLMLRYGVSLYGTAFAATPWQVARWAQRVLRASSRATASPSSITASA